VLNGEVRKYLDPSSPMTLDTGDAISGPVTVNILNTSAGIAIRVIGYGDTVNVGDAGGLKGIEAPVTFDPTGGTSTLNLNDSADTTERTASLDFTASSQGSVGNSGTLAITALAPAPINFVESQFATNGHTNQISVSTSLGDVKWHVKAAGMASSSGLTVADNGFPINVLPKNPTAAPDTRYKLPPAGVPLFRSGGPSYLDVRQGSVGDCWLLAGFAEVAARNPQLIRNMFTDEGTMWDASLSSKVEVYLVRFFNPSGVPNFVQVSTLLPNGGAYYDYVTTRLGTKALWVALAEKAYVEANFLGYVKTSPRNTNLPQDSYDVIKGGLPLWSMQAVTGSTLGILEVMSPAAVAAAWERGELVVLGTITPKSSFIAPTHAYPVVAYDKSSKLFELFNPWGPLSASATPTRPAYSDALQNKYGLFWANYSFVLENFAKHMIATQHRRP
jgi:hypothetical protein